MTILTMAEHHRRSMYGHPASQRQREEPKAASPLGKVRRRHVEERAELGEKHHREAKEAALRSQHVDPNKFERELVAMKQRHGEERAKLDSRHQREMRRVLDEKEG